ncbi:hypothetical protein QBC45DRAFT_424155 [Copromyces sp. CBS 386.78]|nr:hypothetical protein QBC45DRAFT_424155 [Copromyces sp. CBS 386.78]
MQSPSTIEVAMFPIPSFLHAGWGPDHQGTLGTSLRLDCGRLHGLELSLPLSSHPPGSVVGLVHYQGAPIVVVSG